ncbi:MAG: helix-turn-helix domain-containing protein [Oscillospiraceae bacterium]|jgi:transcriptional regulator with XRE-family HTH domain|nr:helix-turn-helix domain-containing protein [Oscillospiraceae bacterium]
MELKISENVRRLRRERGLTQESLAESLGVSFQTVSKWECGDGYPDITTLPRIATFFDVSVDEVLGMDDFRDEARIGETEKRAMELRMEGKFAEALAIMRELARDFPRNLAVQRSFASDLLHNTRSPEQQEEGVAILAKVAENCPDNSERLSAIHEIVKSYTVSRDFDKAKEWANKMPSIHNQLYREQIMAVILISARDEAVLTQMRESIITYTAQLQYQISMLMNYEQNFFHCGDREEHIAMLKTTLVLFDITWRRFGLETSGGDNLYAALYGTLASHYVETDAETACDYVELAVTNVLAVNPAEYNNGGVGVQRGYQTDADGTQTVIEQPNRTLADFTLEQFANEAYDPIREYPRFKAAIERLRNN